MSYRVRHPSIHQEEDAVPKAGVLAFIGVVLAVSAVLIVWTVATVDGSYRELRPSGAFTERWLGPRHLVSRVRQDLFDETVPSLGAEERRELRTWGWVDRDRGVVRVPIERAMDLVVAGEHR